MVEGTDYIAKLILDHSRINQQSYLCVEEAAFEVVAGDDFPARYGWTLPTTGLFCPERIARQTRTLSARDRDIYLHAILWVCDRHITLQRQILDDVDRQLCIEDELLELAPGSLAIMSRIELKVLDESSQ